MHTAHDTLIFSLRNLQRVERRGRQSFWYISVLSTLSFALKDKVLWKGEKCV